MQIPSTLLQFSGKTALILVNGSEEADFYLAHDGEINKAAQIRFEKIKFSDREDSGRHGSTAFETGTKIEKTKKENRFTFTKNFREETDKLSADHRIDLVYLLAPEIILKELEESLPASLKSRLVRTFAGNYHKENPIEIIKRIATELGD